MTHTGYFKLKETTVNIAKVTEYCKNVVTLLLAAKAPASATQSAGAGGIGDLLSSVLDANKDGSVMDDLMKQGGGILGSLLGGPKKG